MTAVRLSPLQRQVLEQLAHIRVAPEDAWLTTKRLATLTNRTPTRTYNTLIGLRNLGLVGEPVLVTAEPTLVPNEFRWRITDKGREALG